MQKKSWKNFHVVDSNKMPHSFTRREFINYLINTNQIIKYSTRNARYKKEVSVNELPSLYVTKAGYCYAVVRD